VENIFPSVTRNKICPIDEYDPDDPCCSRGKALFLLCFGVINSSNVHIKKWNLLEKSWEICCIDRLTSTFQEMYIEDSTQVSSS
jgi:hypothetical protein